MQWQTTPQRLTAVLPPQEGAPPLQQDDAAFLCTADFTPIWGN